MITLEGLPRAHAIIPAKRLDPVVAATGWVRSSKLAMQRKAPHSRRAVGIRGAWTEGGGGTHIDPHDRQLPSMYNVPPNYGDAEMVRRGFKR